MLMVSPGRAMCSYPSRSEVTYKRSRGAFGEDSNLCIFFFFLSMAGPDDRLPTYPW